MKMAAERKALDKIYRRRDRYDIPEWQREEVWDLPKKQLLIDSILRGWKLPKFYFVKTADDEYEVVDGQQRLAAIMAFCANELPLSEESAKAFGGAFYRDLAEKVADFFDDFEIEIDIIESATDKELRDFFLRLQAGLPLTSSEKLNAIQSKLRDFCRNQAKHAFFKDAVSVPNTRYAFFDILGKVATVEIEGLTTGLRFEDIKAVFEAQVAFSSNSAVAKRIRAALDLLQGAFTGNKAMLRTRTVIQSLITLACRIVTTEKWKGKEDDIRVFFETFNLELSKQIELGQAATDSDYLTFQQSVNANVKGSALTRHQILLRKLLRISPSLSEVFDQTIVAESGIPSRMGSLRSSITTLIAQLNSKYSARNGEDLFKATNKTSLAFQEIGKSCLNLESYKTFIDNVYFLFRESVGTRLDGNWPVSFADVNELRTDIRHDVDHGDAGKVRAKRRKIAACFLKYSGTGTPETLQPEKFQLVQSNLLTALEGDLRAMLLKAP
jgi:hypothetical protein